MSLEENTKFMREVRMLLRQLTSLVDDWRIERSLIGEIYVDEDSYISEHCAADYLDINAKTLYRLAKDGILPFSKKGRTTIYKICDLRKMLDDNAIPSVQKTIEDVILGHINYVRRKNLTKKNK